MKSISCKGCAHDTRNFKDCKILLERTKPDKICKARMTKEELMRAEKDIDNYRFKLKMKGVSK